MADIIEVTPIKGASPDMVCDRYSNGKWARQNVQVPIEMDFTLYVNSQELVTILCTPNKLNCLVIGFLYSQGIISGVNDILTMRICEDDSLADVTLINKAFKVPAQRTLTSGCGGGVSFKIEVPKVESDSVISPQEVFMLMNKLQTHMELYKVSGGVHASALANKNEIRVVAEDIGRHNTIDKIQGECILRKLAVKDGRLLTTGRITSEMLIKGAKMQTPFIISRTSPTERAINLAQQLGITLVGYVRGEHLSVYSHPEKIIR